jgi:hypothetical protein
VIDSYEIFRVLKKLIVNKNTVYKSTYNLVGNNPLTIEVPSVLRVFDPSKHYLWPIPQKEKTLNPTLGQNPGW